MAEGQSEMLKNLESEVTCPLCLGIFTDPKRLPCDHVYCKQCLRGLGLRSVTGKSISCPECRVDIPIPDNDVANFPTPHQVNRLIEMHLKSAKTETAAPQPAAATCKLHKSQSLDLYCETCESLVCGHCIAETCAKKHEYGFVNEMVKKYHTDFHKELEPVKALHLQICMALRIMSMTEDNLQNKKETKLQQIQATFDALAKIVERERKYFMEIVENLFLKKESLIASKKDEISKTKEEIESLIRHIDETFVLVSKPEILADVDCTRQRIKDLDTYSGSLQLEPTPTPEMEVELLDPAELEDLCKTRNFMYQKGDVVKVHIERSMDLTNDIPVDKTIEVLFNSPTEKNKSSVVAELHSCRDNSKQSVVIKKTLANNYTLSVAPKQRGRHELIIKHNDKYVCGSPLPMYATIDPHLLTTASIIDIPEVVGIKYQNGKLFASKLKEEIVVLDLSTKLTERTIPLTGVNEVVTDGIHIYATDTSKDRIVKMTLNGTVIKSTGSKGDGPGEFDYPNGIRLSKDNKLYVCDSSNGRLQVFDKDLNFKRVIGRKGEKNSCFIFPTDLDFDDAGNLYTVDQNNHRIQVLTPQGQHIRNIKRHGSEQDELTNPVSAAVHRNMIYVTDTRNKRISVFKLTGEFVTTFGERILTHPVCIAIDDNGYIHVSDSRSRLVTF